MHGLSAFFDENSAHITDKQAKALLQLGPNSVSFFNALIQNGEIYLKFGCAVKIIRGMRTHLFIHRIPSLTFFYS
jgi:hypothetical protein